MRPENKIQAKQFKLIDNKKKNQEYQEIGQENAYKIASGANSLNTVSFNSSCVES